MMTHRSTTIHIRWFFGGFAAGVILFWLLIQFLMMAGC